MPTDDSTPPPDLFFEPIVTGYLANPRFVRRNWLAEEIGRRLDAPDARFVLLTAEPGFGKSAFMAQLASDHEDWLRYFIRRDQRSPLSDVGARSFLLRIGFQLAARCPELFSTDAIRLSVEQRVGAVSDQGKLVAAEIGKVRASPFQDKVVQIVQQVERLDGEAVGLRIDELITEPRLLDLTDLQHMALIDPAHALERLHPEATIVILIDALDEVRYHPSDDNVLVWLANIPNLPANIRFVLTSRPPEGGVRLFTDKQRPVLQEVSLSDRGHDMALEWREAVARDVEGYVDRLAQDATIHDALAALPDGTASFKQQAMAKSDGNIGYLDAVARAIDQAHAKGDAQALAALLTLESLPDDMQGLYAFFLRQIRQGVTNQRLEVNDPETGETYDKKVWPAVYWPLLAVLCTAREPVTLDQIQFMGGITANWADLNDAKDGLLQFLDVVDNRYRLYHATVPEFLTDPKTKGDAELEDLYVDASDWHRRIAGRYVRSFGQDWSGCDDYGFAHLPAHLARGGDEEALSRLLWDFGWVQAKLEATNVISLIADYDLTRRTKGLGLVRDALRLSAHALGPDKAQLPGQMVGRLAGLASDDVAGFVQTARHSRQRPWLCPLTPSLMPPGGPLVRTFRGRAGGHAGTPRSIAISADGRLAISAGNSHPDQTVRVWDLDAGRCLYTFPEQAKAGGLTPLAISAERQLALTAYGDEVRVWDLTSGARRGVLPGNGAPVVALELLEDGRQVIVAWDDGTRRRWDVEGAAMVELPTGEVERTAQTAGGQDLSPLLSVSMPSDYPGTVVGRSGTDGLELRVADNGRDIVVWDLVRKGSVLELPHPRTVSAVAITPDGRRALTTDFDHDLRLWDLSCEVVPQPPDSIAEHRFLGFAATGATGLFATPSGETVQRRFGPTGLEEIEGADGAIAQRTLATWQGRGELGRRTLTSLGLEMDGLRMPFVVVSESGERAVTAWRYMGKGRDAEEPEDPVEPEPCLDLMLWDLRATPGGTPLRGHTLPVLDMDMTANGHWVISGGTGRRLRVWDLEHPAQRWVLGGHTGTVFAVGITPDGRHAVSASEDTTLRYWDLDTGRTVAVFTGEGVLNDCWISPDGTAIVARERTGDDQGRFHFLRIQE